MSNYCEHQVGPNCDRRAVLTLHSATDGDEKYCRPCAEGFAERCKDNQLYSGEAATVRRWLAQNPPEPEPEPTHTLADFQRQASGRLFL